MESKTVIGYEFGPYRLLPSERLLLRGGNAVQLTPKAFDTLLAFVKNSGRLLTKDELMDLIWGDTAVEEGNLTQNIFILRKLLGETPQEHKYLVTIPLRGYRFVAPVREVSDPSSFSNSGDFGGLVTTVPISTVAVLPFTLLNEPKGEQLSGVGIADTIITRLSNLKHITVRPTTAILNYADEKPALPTVGRELRVGAVLDGSIQHAGDSVRVSVQLVAVADGKTLWATTYDADDTSSVFSVYDSIAEQVTQALDIELRDDRQQLSRNDGQNTQAYQLYVKGRYFWDTRTEQGLLKGVEYAEQAIALNENNAMAYVGLADSYALLGEYLYVHPNEAYSRAKDAARRARQLDERLAEALASLGEIAFYYEWNWQESEQYYKMALGLKPNYSQALHWYAWRLMCAERFEEALALISRAQTIDPGNLTLNTVRGLPSYYAGNYRQAIAQLRTTLEMEPDFPQAHYYLGAALTQLGSYEEAEAAFMTVIPREYAQQATALLGYTYAVSGQVKKANETLEQLQYLAKQRYVSPYLETIVYCGLGDREQALAQLERACQERATWMVFLKVDPFLNQLRDEPRFKAVVEKVGFVK